MANQVIGLDVEIKVANALAELRKLSPGADKEAKAIAGSLSKALKDAEKQAQATGKALQKTADATKQVSTQTADLGSNGNKALKALGPLGGVLGRLSPEAGAAASSIAGLTSAFEGFEAAGFVASGPVMLGLAAALAVVGVAVYEVVGVMDDYTAASKAAEKANLSFKAAMQPMADAVKAAKEEQKLLNAAIESGNAQAYLKVGEIAAATTLKEAAATAELRAEKEQLTTALKTEQSVYEKTLMKGRIQDIDEAVGAVHKERNELTRLQVTNMTLREHIGKTTGETKTATVAVAKHTDGLKDLNEQLAREAELNQRNTAAYRSSIEILNAAESQAKRAMASKEEQLALDHTAAIQRLKDANRDVQVSEVTTSAKELAEQDMRAAIIATDAQYYAERDALRAEDAARDKEAKQTKLDEDKANNDLILAARKDLEEKGVALGFQALDALAQGASDAAQHQADEADKLQAQLIAGDEFYTDAQKAELQKRIAEHRKAAMTAFAISKAARIAEATITTAMAVVNALNDGLAVGGPAGLIIGPVSAAAAGIAGGIQIAAIAAEQPSFHQGYAPDERSARVLTSEAVLSPAATAALGSGNIAAANAGIMGGGRQASTPVVFRHQTFRPFIKDFLTQPSALSSALNAGKIVGHRARN